MNKKAIQKYDPKPLIALCEPLLNSYAFNRLEKISFLGILSPRYLQRFKDNFSFRGGSVLNEGSRRDHSIGVALLSFEIASKLNFSAETTKYAVCWGLLHDIATWPLSHTGEAAFSHLFKLSSRKLREDMILGSSSLPKKYQVKDGLVEMGIDPNKLINLFKNTNDNDGELSFLSTIIHSPITPDTLEGIWRTGKVWNVSVPDVVKRKSKLQLDLFGPYIPKQHSKMYVNFWRQKSVVYERFINNEQCIAFESAWSVTIREYFNNVNLIESLELDENDIINRVMERGLLHTDEILKYKTPQVYSVKEDKKLGDINLKNLSEYFIKKDQHGTSTLPKIPA